MPNSFLKQVHNFAVSLAMYERSSFPHPHQCLLLSVSLMVTILVGAKWYLIMSNLVLKLLLPTKHFWSPRLLMFIWGDWWRLQGHEPSVCPLVPPPSPGFIRGVPAGDGLGQGTAVLWGEPPHLTGWPLLHPHFMVWDRAAHLFFILGHLFQVREWVWSGLISGQGICRQTGGRRFENDRRGLVWKMTSVARPSITRYMIWGWFRNNSFSGNVSKLGNST